MSYLLMAQIILNSYQLVPATPATPDPGFFLQEDGAFLMQQDSTSKLKKEFTSATGFIMQQNGTSFLMQQDSTGKLQQQQ